MATIYHPATINYIRHAGDTTGIGMAVPIAVSLSGKIVRFQMRERGSGKLKLQKLSTVTGEITVTGQAYWVQFLNIDVKLLHDTYNYEIECYTANLSTVQTLQKGMITFEEENSHA